MADDPMAVLRELVAAENGSRMTEDLVRQDEAWARAKALVKASAPTPDAVSVTLSFNEWVSVGACMTRTLEDSPEHRMADFWGAALAKLARQVEASGG